MSPIQTADEPALLLFYRHRWLMAMVTGIVKQIVILRNPGLSAWMTLVVSETGTGNPKHARM